MRVLIVDDSMVIRNVIKKALGEGGYTDIDQAKDGQEAVDMVGGGDDYGFILMDWNMPNKTGIEAVVEIRANGSKTPIIMCTTESEKGRVVEALKSGANNYIIKPFKAETILEKIKQTIK